jgi:hypothetical protein
MLGTPNPIIELRQYRIRSQIGVNTSRKWAGCRVNIHKSGLNTAASGAVLRMKTGEIAASTPLQTDRRSAQHLREMI